MQVLTLNQQALDKHAERLAALVAASITEKEESFDALIAVLTGGGLVADSFCRAFPARLYAMRCDVELQRPSTRRKNGPLGALLRRLPLWLLDWLRMAESSLLRLTHRHKPSHPLPEVKLPDDLAARLTSLSAPKVLLIDDAIDSGDTLAAVIESLKKANPEVSVSVAVLTVTTRRPRVKADFALYTNSTLIRFPWSKDYKK